MFEDLAVEDVLAAVAGTDFARLAVDDMGASRIDAIAALEKVVRVAQARIAEQVDGLHQDRRSQAAFARYGDPAPSVIGEVGLARQVSPTAATTHFMFVLGLRSMPSVRTAFGHGVISEATARAIVREARTLDPDDALLVDAQIADHLDGLTPGRAATLTREAVIRADAEAAEARAAADRADQHVTYHPEPDGVGTLIVRGPAEQLLATHDTLEAWARGLRASGDPRTIGQIMTSTLVERATGLTHADAIDVELTIVMPLDALTGAQQPADLVGHGPLSPGLAAEIATRATHTWYRRLLTDPVTDTLVHIDPRRRRFTGQLARWIRSRDRHRCRQPSCDCRIRDLDHITPHRSGGPTTRANGQGLCTTSNHLKEQPGWTVTPQPDGTVIWTTPTGHTYTSPVPTYPR